jgi:hypothetical protein
MGLTRRRGGIPFSPRGRRWREAPDEGRAKREQRIARNGAQCFSRADARPLIASLRSALLPQGEKGHLRVDPLDFRWTLLVNRTTISVNLPQMQLILPRRSRGRGTAKRCTRGLPSSTPSGHLPHALRGEEQTRRGRRFVPPPNSLLIAVKFAVMNFWSPLRGPGKDPKFCER